MEISYELFNPSRILACLGALDKSLWSGAIPIFVVLIVVPLGIPTRGPFAIFIRLVKTCLSVCLIYVLDYD